MEKKFSDPTPYRYYVGKHRIEEKIADCEAKGAKSMAVTLKHALRIFEDVMFASPEDIKKEAENIEKVKEKEVKE